MIVIDINENVLHVDILEELNQFHWEHARWTEEKLIAASPFREDNRPSFFVNLQTGIWSDSGAVDVTKTKGNLVWLLALLKGWSYGMTADWLEEKYGFPDVAEMKLKPALTLVETSNYAVLEGFEALNPSEYLESRGISPEIQQLYGVGGDGKKAVMPWRTKDGYAANVKYRRADKKEFWYETDATVLTELVFGYDVVCRENPKTIALCEAEIDAMSWCIIDSNVVGVAVGKSAISEQQIELIKRLNVERIILAGDNDKKGRMLNRQAKMLFGGLFKLEYAEYAPFKDANEKLLNILA
ncbi:toprim domain-containing protein [Listeria monocytogenes]|nr:toprim domain-containing protein [Listeria monocytogenes]EKZ0898476.1 toprim domain-containing protein [Listeria monocytogenes]MBC1704466.1 toprim domain-containing protein [Listeria welshimeri]MBC2339371.1 toprim domain-containing protein [Listeria welshimeri]